LRRIVSDPGAKVVVVERHGGLACFGVEHLEAAWSAHRGRIEIACAGERTDVLVGDSIDVLTSKCARLSGRPGAQYRAVRVLAGRKPGLGEAL
jgi:putative resolvase